jgi:glycosyltransferase involved in cell wall biosynthesis
MSQLVSIGVPVYNGENYLRQALESLLSQSHANIEVIISDNASTDETGRICEEFTKNDSRISCFHQSTNKSAIWNFNFVLRQARGEYFMWAAHDDLWDKDWVSTLLRNYTDKTAISFGHVVNVDESGKIIKTYHCSEFKGRRLIRLIRFYLAEDTHGKPNLIYGLYKTAMLKQLGFKEYGGSRYGQDMQFIFSCLPHGTITTDPSVLLYKRVITVRNNGMTLWDIFSSIFLLNRIGSYLTYPSIVPNPAEKMAIAALFPFKYLASFINAFVTRIVRCLPSMQSVRKARM